MSEPPWRLPLVQNAHLVMPGPKAPPSIKLLITLTWNCWYVNVLTSLVVWLNGCKNLKLRHWQEITTHFKQWMKLVIYALISLNFISVMIYHRHPNIIKPIKTCKLSDIQVQALVIIKLNLRLFFAKNTAESKFMSSMFQCAAFTLWGHPMEAFSVLLALCVANSPVTSEFPAQRPMTQSFDALFDLHLEKQLSKQPWCWSFGTPSQPLCRHRNELRIPGKNPYLLFRYLLLQKEN